MRGANQATLQELAERIDQADAVVIGGGSGLSPKMICVSRKSVIIWEFPELQCRVCFRKEKKVGLSV